MSRMVVKTRYRPRPAGSLLWNLMNHCTCRLFRTILYVLRVVTHGHSVVATVTGTGTAAGISQTHSVLHVLGACTLHSVQNAMEAVLHVRLAHQIRYHRDRFLPWDEQADFLDQTLLNIDLDLHLLLLLLLLLFLLIRAFRRFQLDALLDGEFRRLANAPVPGGKVLPQLADSGEPLLGGIDQLEAELFHQQITTTIRQLRGRRAQEFVSNGR